MPNRYIERSLEPVLQQAAGEVPVIVLTGPRQSGETTLLKHVFAQTYRYVSLEPPDLLMTLGGFSPKNGLSANGESPRRVKTPRAVVTPR